MVCKCVSMHWKACDMHESFAATLVPDREIEFNCSNTAFSTLTFNTMEDQMVHLVH